MEFFGTAIASSGAPATFHQKSEIGSLRYIVLTILTLLLALPACQTDDSVIDDQASIEVEDVKYSLLPGGARIVTGTLYNPTDILVRNAQIQVSLFDENNRRVDGMSITVQDVPPGERKPFRKPVESDMDIRGAKVRSVLVL